MPSSMAMRACAQNSNWARQRFAVRMMANSETSAGESGAEAAVGAELLGGAPETGTV